MIIQMNTISPELTCCLHTVAAAAGAGAEYLAVVITHLERLSGLTLGPH